MTGVAIVLIVIGLLFVFFVALPFVGAWMERRR
jgi:Sec-independent protein secretion pathway component TatC